MAEVEVQQSAPQEPESLGHADIVLGVISYNNADTIADVVRTGQEGLRAFFPSSRGVLVHADGGSKDGTPGLALEAAPDKSAVVQVPYQVYPVHKLSQDTYGVPGRSNALRAIFEVAGKLTGKACAVVDSGIRGLRPESIGSLLAPVVEKDFDFVSPCYLRDKYEGAILSGIVYPLTRALYGKRIRQPIGGDFAFSAKLMEHLMQQAPRDGDTAAFAIDFWITTQAATGGFRLAQAQLGPRVLSQNAPVPEASSVLAQVLGSIFAEMNRTPVVWQRVRGSQAVPVFGDSSQQAAEPAPADVGPMLDSFRLGYQNLQDIWRLVLPSATMLELKHMSHRAPETFAFEDALWARVVYDFGLAYRMRVMDRDHLLRALTPLYLGWVASYVLQVHDKTVEEAQDRIERLCLAYEAQKAYLISRWRWPDRFNP